MERGVEREREYEYHPTAANGRKKSKGETSIFIRELIKRVARAYRDPANFSSVLT